MDKVRKRGSVEDCVTEPSNELEALAKHVFVAEWQRRQMQELKANLPDSWVFVTCDFAENFLCKYQDEPQSAHWGYKQVSLFPAVAYYRCSADGCSDLVREEIAFVSDELQKDAHLTQACVDYVSTYLQKKMGPRLKKVILASDGCAAQFKSKLPFLLLSHSQNENFQIEKVFWGPSWEERF